MVVVVDVGLGSGPVNIVSFFRLDSRVSLLVFLWWTSSPPLEIDLARLRAVALNDSVAAGGLGGGGLGGALGGGGLLPDGRFCAGWGNEGGGGGGPGVFDFLFLFGLYPFGDDFDDDSNIDVVEEVWEVASVSSEVFVVLLSEFADALLPRPEFNALRKFKTAGGGSTELRLSEFPLVEVFSLMSELDRCKTLFLPPALPSEDGFLWNEVLIGPCAPDPAPFPDVELPNETLRERIPPDETEDANEGKFGGGGGMECLLEITDAGKLVVREGNPG